MEFNKIDTTKKDFKEYSDKILNRGISFNGFKFPNAVVSFGFAKFGKGNVYFYDVVFGDGAVVFNYVKCNGLFDFMPLAAYQVK